MKIRSFILMAAAAAALASCGGRVSETTEIIGKFGEGYSAEVKLKVGALDTTMVISDGTFNLTVPTDNCDMGVVGIGRNRASFIPDGSRLTVDFTGSMPIVLSDNPKSLTSKLNEMNEYTMSFFQENRMKIEQMELDGASDEERSAFVDSLDLVFVNHCKDQIKENSDNYLGVYALRYISNECDQDEVLQLVDCLSDEAKATDFVKNVVNSIKAERNTAEGQMFTDFTVNSVVGMTRSIPPQYKYADVKLSDYVGKGKYILVDFWASWCGPCKAEVPNLKKVYDKYYGDDFDMLSIAVWDKVDLSLNTAEELGMNWNHIVNAESQPLELYGIQGIPHIILFGPDGRIIKRNLRGDDIELEVAKYIRK